MRVPAHLRALSVVLQMRRAVGLAPLQGGHLYEVDEHRALGAPSTCMPARQPPAPPAAASSREERPAHGAAAVGGSGSQPSAGAEAAAAPDPQGAAPSEHPLDAAASYLADQLGSGHLA